MSRDVLRKVLNTWAAIVLCLVALAFADTVVFHQLRKVGDYFFFGWDLPVLIGASLFLILLGRVRLAAPSPAPDLGPGAVGALGVAIAALAWVGARLIFRGYALSLDEFMADFDADIFATGRLFAPVAEAWRPFVRPLQPLFVIATPDHAMWASAYLPVNAMIRALAGLVGARSLVNPVMAGISVIALAGVARRLWPERRDIAGVAVVLLATSSQLLFTGMTHFSMPAHLALNLLWLWCFLSGGRFGHVAALGLALLATGLHQLLFHPLFAAPFVLQLWLDRRWRLAGLYTAAYGAILLFWLLYWNLALKASGAVPQHGGDGGPAWFLHRVTNLLSEFKPVNIGSMAKDLARFVAWQNPMTVPLAGLGIVGAFRAKGELRALALGVALTLAAMFVLLPYQDHGWGYRYLHGLLGSICLLAAWAWAELVKGLPESERRAAAGAFAAAAVVAVMVLWPLRTWQVARYVQPYAAASAAIARADADVVLVDDSRSWYTIGLVRNDPLLRSRPVVMHLEMLDDRSVRALCASRRVLVFDQVSAQGFGIRGSRPLADQLAISEHVRGLMRQLSCGAAFPEGGG